MILRLLLSVAIALTFAPATPARADEPARPPIVNFRIVTQGKIYRGGRPETAGMRGLAANSVRTIINLEDALIARYVERNQAEALGIQFLSFPMNAALPFNDTSVDQALKELGDPSNYPVFLHCQHGRDRTGLVIGLHRVLHDGWAPQAAYDEMLEGGFRTIFYFLDREFRTRTGFNGSGSAPTLGNLIAGMGGSLGI